MELLDILFNLVGELEPVTEKSIHRTEALVYLTEQLIQIIIALYMQYKGSKDLNEITVAQLCKTFMALYIKDERRYLCKKKLL
jgi:positive regulator of sigma E activity